MTSSPPKTNVYIDGFNLYYGAIKGTPYRWLDIGKFCQLMLPKNTIQAIKYFTALVTPRPHDPDQPVRQQMYLRALGTLPQVSLILGHFLAHSVTMPLSNPIPGGPTHASVVRTEEKGSDVNLATHLLCDAFRNVFDIAVVVSNDSDLLEPIKIVRQELGKRVGILNPHKHPSQVLVRNSDFFKSIRPGVLRASQFPQTLTDSHGTFHKPDAW